MKYNWNSTRKLKRKNFLGFILQDITPWNHKKVRNCFLGVLWGSGNQCGIQWFFMILWISESFCLYHLVKNSFDLKVRFFTYFEYISRGIIRKNILRSDYHSARWYWCKKDQKNLPQTSHKIFFSRLNCEFFIAISIYNSKLL